MRDLRRPSGLLVAAVLALVATNWEELLGR
jgi:hypothetical protein